MTTVENQQGNLRLRKIELINYENKYLNIQNLFREIEIIESIGSIWLYGELTIEEQFNYRENFPFIGKEKLHIVWDTGEETTIRDFTFIITAIPNISETKTNEIYKYKLEFIHEDFANFLEAETYKKSFENKTNSYMLETLFSNYNIITENKVLNDTDTYSYIANSYDIIETIEEIEYLSDDPKFIFQRGNNYLIYNIESLFAQQYVKKLSNVSIITEGDGNRNSIRGISKIEPMMRKDFYEDGINGYIHYDIDLFEEKYNLNDISLNVTNPKFDFVSSKRNVLTLKSSKFIEDYMLTDAIQAQMQIASSDLQIGDLIQLKYFLGQNDQKNISKYSGFYLLYEIVHKIDVNFNYSMLLTLVRKDMSKSLF